MVQFEDVELNYPQEHNKNTFICGRILTGDWQKDACTTKAVRKIHTELGGKGREEIRLGPVSLGGDLEVKGDYMDRQPPWGMSSLSYILGTPVLSNTGKTTPLA